MPLNIEMKRNGRTLKRGPSGKGWRGHDLNAAYTVAIGEATPDQEWTKDLTVGQILDQGKVCDVFAYGYGVLMALDGDSIPLIATGQQKVQRDHKLGGGVRFKAGDVIASWRSYK